MREQQIQAVIDRQRAFFAGGAGRTYEARRDALNRVEEAVRAHERELYAALAADLGKSETESYMCEVGLVLGEITWMRRHLRRLMGRCRVPTPLSQMVASSYRSPSPYGTVLVMSPWNYPVLLTLEPLVDALAAGNTVVLKPSAYAPATSAALASLLGNCFNPEQVAVVTGGRAQNQALLRQKWDKIFFTGSTAVGREVLRAAAEHLTPCALELGGKSPCIVEASANVKMAARRIVFGKFVNCGQTCVAPDYVLVDRTRWDELIEALVAEVVAQYGADPLSNPDYGRIVSQKHFDRLLGLVDPGKVVLGGRSDRSQLRIEPTVMAGVTWDDAVMGEEIFGPVLPILAYDDLNKALAAIDARPRPLALYLFTEDEEVKRHVLDSARFGGGCVNDTIIHLATSEMPFGGVGESGMGCYHGAAGFEEFSHLRSIVDKSTRIDLPMRYQPYTEGSLALIKRFL